MPNTHSDETIRTNPQHGTPTEAARARRPPQTERSMTEQMKENIRAHDEKMRRTKEAVRANDEQLLKALRTGIAQAVAIEAQRTSELDAAKRWEMQKEAELRKAEQERQKASETKDPDTIQLLLHPKEAKRPDQKPAMPPQVEERLTEERRREEREAKERRKAEQHARREGAEKKELQARKALEGARKNRLNAENQLEKSQHEITQQRRLATKVQERLKAEEPPTKERMARLNETAKQLHASTPTPERGTPTKRPDPKQPRSILTANRLADNVPLPSVRKTNIERAYEQEAGATRGS